MRRPLALTFLVLLAIAPMGARADDEGMPVVPESGFTGHLVEPGTCLRPDGAGGEFAAYGDRCARLRFKYGPILVQPGDNDTGLSFKTIEKPWYDGYMVGIRPNLVTPDGQVPDIENMHLHHATWLSNPSYGNGPFFAAGEEKTIARFPVGYGMPVRATDVWYFVHMIHNEGTRPELVYVTYDVDYVSRADAEALGIQPIKPFWLDVWKNGTRANYPVYNTQRGFGEPITDQITLDIITDPETGEPYATTECTWPRDECGAFDSWGGTDVGQGAPGNGKGTDIFTPASMAGTLIGVGGHLHPGGTRVEIDIVRCSEGAAIRPGGTISSWGGLACPDANDDGTAAEEARRIFTSDAVYFNADPEGVPFAPKPTSWNFSMTVAGLPNWKVNLNEGEFLRINSVYETSIASWYEGMGIAVAYVAPGSFGIDPFSAEIRNDLPAEQCWATLAEHPNRLCTRGVVTHGPLPEASNPGGSNERAFTPVAGPQVSDVQISGFLYAPGELGLAESIGLPTVKADAPLTFWNLDAAANIFHSVTACAFPCNGTTGISYPVADFGFGRADVAPAGAPIAFDSAELGFSPDFGPAKGQIPTTSGEFPSDPPTWAVGAVSWTIVPAEHNLHPGDVVTYFCRIHPFMRGGFIVVE